jgi:hypothetical protein
MSLRGMNSTTEQNENMNLKDFNMEIGIATNNDVSIQINIDYLSRFLYLELYNWKWNTIYLTLLFILWVFFFNII